MKADYETLVQYNSKLIYGHASGWGAFGPDADDPAYDLAGQGRGGLMGCTLADDGTPIPIGSGLADEAGAVLLAYGMVLALFARERTGEGQLVDASLLGGQVEMCRLWFHGYLSGGLNLAVPYKKASSNPLWFHYKCQDDKWIVLAMLQPDRMWPGFCKALKIEHLEKDPKFENQAARAVNIEEIRNIITDILLTKPKDEWIGILKEQGCVVAPVNDFADLAKDAQVLANEYITDIEDPRHPDGKYKVPGIPVKLSKTPGRVTTPAPELGQHTEEVLMDILGYSWENLTKLRDEGVY